MIDANRRTSRAQGVFILLLIIVVATMVWQFVSFQQALARMPRGWTVAGAPASDLTSQQVLVKLIAAYNQPVFLRYRDAVIELPPPEVDFYLDIVETTRLLDEARYEASGGSRGFLHFLTQRTVPPRDVLPAATFSEEKLRAFLTHVSERHDLPPTTASPLIEELRFVPGQPGSELDISGSVPAVAAALRSASQRDAALVVKTLPPIPPKLKLLQDLLRAYLQRQANIQAGVFIKDLQTGEEIGLNDDVAFSGMGLLKLPIVAETYRRLPGLPDAPTLDLIRQAAASESDNNAANALLQQLGEGDAFAGTERLLPSLRYLGLVNTFLAVPYDQNVTTIAVVTPANSRPDVSTNPDPRMQTTAQDTGILLEMIYLCSRGGGALMVAYPSAFTPDKCSQLLNLLAQAKLADPNSGSPMFISAGLPAGTRLAHKWSYDREVRGDAGIVSTSHGDWVLVILLRQFGSSDWQRATPIMADVAQATYSYFTLPR